MIVTVRNGCKSYIDGTPVLNQLNLNVKTGTIYSLLGESGCGKTTLLSCIVGLKKLNSGDIYVNGSSPGMKGSNIPGVGIGFMPQSTSSLTLSLSISQTFWFYGRIYGIPKNIIEKRITFLSEFLQLSDSSKIIQDLSGGEWRRVSLGVALIHKPPLLILDEPTVGLDPLLRQSIWKHFLELVTKENITILLTTHYSEEAKSGTIGIMRKGRLIAEENPDLLLSQTNSLLLETAIVKLCREDDLGSKLNHAPQSVAMKPCPSIEIESWRMFYRKNVIITYALLYKTLMIYRRQPVILLTQLLMPLINIVLAGLVLGKDPNGLRLDFVNNDWSDLQNQTVIEYCTNYKLIKNKTCFPGGIETLCVFLNQYEKNEIIWSSKASELEAMNSVKNGDSIGYASFPTNFSQHLAERLLFRAYSGNETIEKSTISIRMDMTNAISTMWLFEKAVENYAAFINELINDCDVNSTNFQIPLKYNSVYGEKNGVSWSQFMQPFLIMVLMYMLSSSVSGGCFILEKILGITERWTIAGIKFTHIIMSNLIFQSCVIIFQIVFLFTFLPYFFGMTVQGSLFLAMATVYLNALNGVANGILLSIILDDKMKFIIVILFLNSLNVFSSGGFWPLESIPFLYRAICQMIPISLPLDSLRSIIFRGWGLEIYKVWRGLAISGVYTIISVLLGNWLYNRK